MTRFFTNVKTNLHNFSKTEAYEKCLDRLLHLKKKYSTFFWKIWPIQTQPENKQTIKISSTCINKKNPTLPMSWVRVTRQMQDFVWSSFCVGPYVKFFGYLDHLSRTFGLKDSTKNKVSVVEDVYIIHIDRTTTIKVTVTKKIIFSVNLAHN